MTSSKSDNTRKKRGRPPGSKNKVSTKAGIPTPPAVSGKINKQNTMIAKKAKQANIATTAQIGWGNKEAGMMINQSAPFGMPSGSQGRYDAYWTSYADGSNDFSGTYDIPLYFVIMNQQNGGVIYWPTTLKERYSWYRYFVRSEAYVGRAMELLTDLPMSKITLNMPLMKDKKLRKKIHDFYKAQCEHINLFDKLGDILWEENIIGNVFSFQEWNEDRGRWEKMIFLPPEECRIFYYPFSDEARVEYYPEKIVELIRLNVGNENGSIDMDDFQIKMLDEIPKDVKDMVAEHGAIVMDTDPATGSFVFHFARRKHPYQDLGASVLERVLVPLLQKEHYRYTQLSLASRNMTPKNKISAPGLSQAELDDLRDQIDLSYFDPDYSVVTNYDWDWEQIGTESRLLDLGAEYERIENQIFAALGVTRELLTGEGTFGGERINIEIMNTMFLKVREKLQNFVEQKLFRPIAEHHKWYTVENGIKKYFYPKLGFNRLTIRDNEDVFDRLFQLYQKGSLPVSVIYELFNLDADTMNEKLLEDMFTVRDSTFNRLVEGLNEGAIDELIETTDFVASMKKYLKLKKKPEEEMEQDEDDDYSFDSEDSDESEEENNAEDDADEREEDSENRDDMRQQEREDDTEERDQEQETRDNEKDDQEDDIKKKREDRQDLIEQNKQEKTSARGMQLKRKDKDLMRDTGGASNNKGSDAKHRPPRDDVRKPFETRNKRPENKDPDIDKDPDLNEVD